MIKYPILILLTIYKKIISPLLGNHCRFYPTCSVYYYQAVAKYGGIKGSYLGIRRLLKCHPWHPGGYDEVPNNFKAR